MHIHAASSHLSPLLAGKTAALRSLAQAGKPAVQSPSLHTAAMPAASGTASAVRGGFTDRSAALRTLHSIGLRVKAAAATEKNAAAQPAAPAAPAAPAPSPSQAAPAGAAVAAVPAAPPGDGEIILATTQQTPSLTGLLNAWGTDDATHDLNGDGNVGVSDLYALLQQLQDLLANWGQGESPLGGEGETIGVPDLLAFLGQA